MNPNVNHGPWVIMMCWWRFIDWNKCSILGEDVDNGGSEYIESFSVLSVQFCGKLKTSLKIKFYFIF